MIFLGLTILCSTLILSVIRLSQDRVKSETGMFAANYVTCMLLALLHSTGTFSGFESGTPEEKAFLLLLGLVTGILFAANFVINRHCMRLEGIALASTFMKLGVLIPTVMSILFFHEEPTLCMGSGILLAVFGIVLLGMAERKKSGETENGSRSEGGVLLLLSLFACSGLADASNKIFEELGNPEWKGLFLLSVFSAALLFCLILMAKRGERPEKQDLRLGVLLGIPNYYSSLCFLKALSQMKAVVVYPVYSCGTILAATLCGIFVFHERPDSGKIKVLLLLLAALILLNL